MNRTCILLSRFSEFPDWSVLPLHKILVYTPVSCNNPCTIQYFHHLIWELECSSSNFLTKRSYISCFIYSLFIQINVLHLILLHHWKISSEQVIPYFYHFLFLQQMEFSNSAHMVWGHFKSWTLEIKFLCNTHVDKHFTTWEPTHQTVLG